MPKAYLSGLMIMHKPSEGHVDASVINEFGISLMDISYDEKKDKVKIHSITDKMNKWYIKRSLSGDFKNIFKAMHQGSHLGIMDYYRMKNMEADTSMRQSIGQSPTSTPEIRQ